MPISYRPLNALDMTLSAPGTQTDFVVSRALTVEDITIAATATQAGGTIQLQRQALGAGAFNNVSNAIVCDTAGVVTRAGTLANAEVAFASTDVARLAVAGAGTAGRIRGLCFYDAISGGS